MEKLWNKILILASCFWICFSCTSDEERIIKQACSSLIIQEKEIQKKLSVISYLMVTEQSIKDNYATYTIESKIFQAKDKPISYTMYYKKDGIYVFIKLKNKQEHSTTKEIEEEIYNWGDWNIKYESPSYTLTINLLNQNYSIERDRDSAQ